MNPRWFVLGAAFLLPLAGCSNSDDSSTASPVSFAAASSPAATATAAAGTGDVPRAAAGTVCGAVDVPKGSAAVVVREGRVNCVDALRVGRVYVAAATQAEGRAVSG